MSMLDPEWKRGDAPWELGRGPYNGQRARKGCLSWYQPWGRCHWIAFFAMAIGVKNYPDLDWGFVSGDVHTVAVGNRGGEPHVVMDILNFARMTAEESIAHARRSVGGAPEADHSPEARRAFIERVVPRLKGAA